MPKLKMENLHMKRMINMHTLACLLISVSLLIGCAAPAPTEDNTPTLTPAPIVISLEQAADIDKTLDENLSVYGGDLGLALSEGDRRRICEDWQRAGWNYDSIPDAIFTVRHGELPMAIRDETGLSMGEPADRMVEAYCAHKLR